MLVIALTYTGKGAMAFRPTRMKARRVELGLSQAEFAQRVKISQQQVSIYESGKTKPSADVLALIAKALDCSADFLLGLTDDSRAHLRESELSAPEREFLRYFRRRDLRGIQEAVADWLEEKLNSDPSLVAGE